MASLDPSQKGSAETIVLAPANAGARILVTEDRDFGELVIRQRLPVVGVLLLELDQLSNESEARVLSVVEALADRMRGTIAVSTA